MAFHHGAMPPPAMGPQMGGPMHSAGPPIPQPPGQAMPPGMHPGMPGPGGPHVTQGQMMGGMPPGMNPNAAHAMSHLQPQQMFANQGMPAPFPQNNQGQPNAQALMQQTQAIERQRAAMAQNARASGMPPNMNMNMMQNPMGPQQFQGMQPQNLRHYNLPNAGGLQQQMRQQNLMLAQMQQGGGGTPGVGGGPAGGNNGGQVAGAQQMNGPPGQPTPMRPQSSMQGMPPNQGPNQDHPQQTPNQQARPAPEQMQPQNQGQQEQASNQRSGPQTQSNPTSRPPSSQPVQQPPSTQSQSSPAPSMQQAPNGGNQQAQQNTAQSQQVQQQQQGQQQGQQPGGQQIPQPGQAPGPLQPGQAANQEAARQHFEHMRRAQLTQSAITNTGLGVLRLVQFADRLSGFPNIGNPHDLDEWKALVTEFFSDDANHRVVLGEGNNATGKDTYDIPAAALARYYMVQFASGIKSMSISTGGASWMEYQGSQYVECRQATFSYLYSNSLQIKCDGTLRAMVGPHGKFDLLEFEMSNHEEYIPSAQIRKMFASESPQSQTKSPKLVKGNSKKNQQKAPPQRSITLNESQIPNTPVQQEGVTLEVHKFLESTDNFARMGELLNFAQSQDIASGHTALEHYIQRLQQQQQQQLQQHQQQLQLQQQRPPGGAGGPGMPPNPQLNVPMGMNPNAMAAGGVQFRHPFAANGPPNMNAFNSPGHQGLGLPNATNSPQMRPGGSPGHPGMMGGMQPPMAAPMMPQQSGQGTNSSNAPSSNASPNVQQSKKRRASAVKGEGPEEGQANGMGGNDAGKLKATPKIGGKRQKGNG